MFPDNNFGFLERLEIVPDRHIFLGGPRFLAIWWGNRVLRNYFPPISRDPGGEIGVYSPPHSADPGGEIEVISPPYAGKSGPPQAEILRI